jgi:hypothetical protein
MATIALEVTGLGVGTAETPFRRGSRGSQITAQIELTTSARVARADFSASSANTECPLWVMSGKSLVSKSRPVLFQERTFR